MLHFHCLSNGKCVPVLRTIFIIALRKNLSTVPLYPQKYDTRLVHVSVYFTLYLQKKIFDTICIPFFSLMYFVAITKYLNHSSVSSPLRDLASYHHVVPVEVSRVWSRSHIHKVCSPELFKNITKSHTHQMTGLKRDHIVWASRKALGC